MTKDNSNAFQSFMGAFDHALNVHPHLVLDIVFDRTSGWVVIVWDTTGLRIEDVSVVTFAKDPDRDKALNDSAAKLRELFPRTEAQAIASNEEYYADRDDFIRHIATEVNPARRAAGLTEINENHARECFRIMTERFLK